MNPPVRTPRRVLKRYRVSCTNFHAEAASHGGYGRLLRPTSTNTNGRGETDLLVRHQGLNAFIGECKFWDGPRKFSGAIGQFLSYTVWRDNKAATGIAPGHRGPPAPVTEAIGLLRRRGALGASLA
jgi:hypothetical protein